MENGAKEILDTAIMLHQRNQCPPSYWNELRIVSLAAQAESEVYRVVKAVSDFAWWLENDSFELRPLGDSRGEDVERVTRDQLFARYQSMFGKRSDKMEAIRYWHERVSPEDVVLYL